MLFAYSCTLIISWGFTKVKHYFSTSRKGNRVQKSNKPYCRTGPGRRGDNLMPEKERLKKKRPKRKN